MKFLTKFWIYFNVWIYGFVFILLGLNHLYKWVDYQGVSLISVLMSLLVLYDACKNISIIKRCEA